MRMSNLLMPTLREVPAEAEITSHKLMLRAGLIRKLAAVYTHIFRLDFALCKRLNRLSVKKWTTLVHRNF